MAPLLFLALLPVLEKPDFAAWGTQTLDLVDSKYLAPNGRHLDWVGEGDKKSNDPVFAWGLGVSLSAWVAEAKVHPKTGLKRLDAGLKELAAYGSKEMPNAFSVWPNLGSPDRFYDDNAWLALALVEANDWLGRKDCLQMAKGAFEFMLSGEDDKLGGGIYWHERKKTEKNTCINAPAALVAFKLYGATKDKKYLDAGNRIIEWLKGLQDEDGLFFDNINLSGKVEKFKWSYNSALPIRAYVARYKLLKKPEDLKEAKRIGEAARKHWVDPTTGALKDEAAFAHHLAEAFLDLADATKDKSWREITERALVYLHDKARRPDGLYGSKWNSPNVGQDGHIWMLFQSAAARVYFRASDGFGKSAK